MGVGEVDGPPRKKLKQAQLPFCIISAEKSSNKRKLNSESPESGLALKVSRKESTPRALVFNKENVKVSDVEKITEVVDLLSEGEEDEISKPTNETVIKESVTKCVDAKASGKEPENCKENVGKKDVRSKLNEDVKSSGKADDVSTELKKIDGEHFEDKAVGSKLNEDVKSSGKADDVSTELKKIEGDHFEDKDVGSKLNEDVKSPGKADDVGTELKKIEGVHEDKDVGSKLNEEVKSSGKADDVDTELKKIAGEHFEDKDVGSKLNEDVKSPGKADDVGTELKKIEGEHFEDKDVGSKLNEDVKSSGKADDVGTELKKIEDEHEDKDVGSKLNEEVKSSGKADDVSTELKKIEGEHFEDKDVGSKLNEDEKSSGKADDVGTELKKIEDEHEDKDVGSKLNEEVKSSGKADDVSTELKKIEGDHFEDKDVGSKLNEGVKSAGEVDDVSSELKKTKDEEVIGSEIADKFQEQTENKDAEESQNKVEENIEVVDESKQADESVQGKVVNENAATEGSQITSDEGKESKSASESKETSDLNSSCDDAVDSSQLEPKLNQSIGSDQGDLNSSIILSSEDEHNVSTSLSSKGSATTPKLKKVDRVKLREEKTRLKKEKEELRRLKREEREKKEKIKEEERKKKEDERKKREEERKKREELKEEERKKREEERKKREEVKEEERKKREEEKKKKEESKEEDRKKKEEARLAEERKEKLAKMAFTKFFIQSKSKSCASKKEEVDTPTESAETPKFMPFPVKADMRLAVQVRHSISNEEKKVLSDALESSCSPGKLYLDEIKEGLKKPCTGPATWPLSEEQHDVIIVESVEEKSDHGDEAALCVKTKHQRAKLLQFHDNRRPPYWGTWRKKSSAVMPRKPFGQDKVFDYEVDSDSEWEDEEEGEDIDKEGESDKEQSDDENVGEDGYLLDNTFVPHGYLSDEEAAEEEENLNPEDQKLKLKVLKQEFEQELKAKTRLKPRLLGCVWISNETTEVSKGSLYETLMNFRCKWDEPEGPIDPSGPAIVDCTPSPSLANVKFPSTLIEQLVKLVHGSRLSHINLVTEFMNSLDKERQLSSISKRAVSLKIKEIALKTPSPMGRAVWTVSPELCAEYNLPSLEPPSIPSPAVPVLDTPPPKPKETALVSFLKKASSPSGPKRRVTPTLVSPVIDLTGTKSGNTTAPSDTSKTETSVALPGASKPDTAAAPSGIAKPGNTMTLHGATKTGNAAATPPAAPPVRKRIQPITLSKTISPSTKTPTTPKMVSVFRNPIQDTPRPPPAPPRSLLPVVDLCNDSN